MFTLLENNLKKNVLIFTAESEVFFSDNQFIKPYINQFNNFAIAEDEFSDN